MIRAVLDTNVIVSGVIKGGGPPGQLLTALFDGRFQAVTTPEFLTEIMRVLGYPKIRQRYHVTPETAEAVVTAMAVSSELIPLPPTIARASRDPDDDRFLACAVAGRADAVVTGDQDLLVLREFRGIPIVSAGAFCAVASVTRHDGQDRVGGASAGSWCPEPVPHITKSCLQSLSSLIRS